MTYLLNAGWAEVSCERLGGSERFWARIFERYPISRAFGDKFDLRLS